MTTKTMTRLHPLLQEIFDALPEDMREATREQRESWDDGGASDRLYLTHYGPIALDDFAIIQDDFTADIGHLDSSA